MKNIFSLLLLAILTLSSCTSDELMQESEKEALLKSYTLTRDYQGRYSIDYESVNDDVVDVIKDAVENTNEVSLFSGDVIISQYKNQPLSLEDAFLESYNITNNGSEFFKLDFTVKKGVTASYEYNEQTASYEIHLNQGGLGEDEFSMTYVKASEVLKIDFVSDLGTALTASARRGGGPRSSNADAADDD